MNHNIVYFKHKYNKYTLKLHKLTGGMLYSTLGEIESYERTLEHVKLNGLLLKKAPDFLKKDPDIVMAAVCQNTKALQYADDILKTSRGFIMSVLEVNPSALQYVTSPRMIDNANFLMTVIELYDAGMFKFASNRLKKSQDFILKLVSQNSDILEHADNELKKDPVFMMKVVKESGFALQFASDIIRETHFDIVLAAVQRNGHAVEYALGKLKLNRDIALAAVSENSHGLKYIDETLKGDAEIVLTAMSGRGRGAWILQFADKSLFDNKEFILAAIQHDGFALEYANDKMKKDPRIVIAAMRETIHALQFAHYNIRTNRDFVKRVVHNIGWFDKLVDNKIEYILEALTRNGLALQYALQEHKGDKNIVLCAMRQNVRALKYANISLTNNYEFMKNAVSLNPDALYYATTRVQTILLQEMRDANVAFGATSNGTLSPHVYHNIKKYIIPLKLMK